MAKKKETPVSNMIDNDFIEVVGAKEHNLKNIDIKIPKNNSKPNNTNFVVKLFIIIYRYK